MKPNVFFLFKRPRGSFPDRVVLANLKRATHFELMTRATEKKVVRALTLADFSFSRIPPQMVVLTFQDMRRTTSLFTIHFLITAESLFAVEHDEININFYFIRAAKKEIDPIRKMEPAVQQIGLLTKSPLLMLQYSYDSLLEDFQFTLDAFGLERGLHGKTVYTLKEII